MNEASLGSGQSASAQSDMRRWLMQLPPALFRARLEVESGAARLPSAFAPGQLAVRPARAVLAGELLFCIDAQRAGLLPRQRRNELVAILQLLFSGARSLCVAAWAGESALAESSRPSLASTCGPTCTSSPWTAHAWLIARFARISLKAHTPRPSLCWLLAI